MGERGRGGRYGAGRCITQLYGEKRKKGNRPRSEWGGGTEGWREGMGGAATPHHGNSCLAMLSVAERDGDPLSFLSASLTCCCLIDERVREE